MTRTLGLKIFVGVVSVVVVATAITGLIVAGSPLQERLRRLDAQRTSDLQSITYAMDQYWIVQRQLPKDLPELLRSRDVYVQNTSDPETGGPYDYRIVDGDTYELCATFQTDVRTKDKFGRTTEPYPYGRQNEFWDHEIGRTCYEIDIHKVDRVE